MIALSKQLLAITAFCILLFSLGDQAQSQVQDVILEKSVCLDDKGKVIRFRYMEGLFPPEAEEISRSEAVVLWDAELLDRVSPKVRLFLITRACVDAALINLGENQSSRLECYASRFLSRRYRSGSRDLFRIIEELSENRDTRDIARNLKACL